LVERTLSEALRQEEAARAGLSAAQTRAILQPVALVSKGLSSRDERTGKISEASDLSRAGAIAVPMVLMMIMFMVLMMNTTPMTQAVVEEKMQRIAEVLLGSVRPFELMLGKLLGMTGVALTIAAVYLIGAIWAADRFGFMELVTAELVAWFVVYLALASLMFGSLFIAVGAACSDLRETQNLIWPLVILICLPLFLLGNILQEPNGPVARNMSFFPFATPLMMVVRQAIPPGIPRWEPIVGVLLVVATTLLCVYAAGRIFRVGILMQGKGARLTEIFKWVVRG